MLPILPIFVLVSLGISDAPEPYTSPESVKLRHSEKELLQDLLDGERGDPERQSAIPFDEWASDATRKKYGAWGPPLKAHEPPEGIAGQSAEWKRERVLALGLRYRGYSYQHHHLPDWEPPTGWPWKEVGRGSNAKGIDCSNFTTFVYDVALGIRFTSAIVGQSEATEALCGGKKVKIERIEKPETVEACAKGLKTGDLLFVKNKDGKVSHVVLWVGGIGGDAPLILDSTGAGHKDSRGGAIPDGVHLRPFRESGWYFKSLSHVHRIIAD